MTLLGARSGTKLATLHDDLVRVLGTGPIDAPLETAAFSPDTLAEARRFWRARTRAEYRSVPVFLGLAAQLHEAGATLDAQTVMLRLAQDELRHTEICAGLLEALGDEAKDPVDTVSPPLAAHAGCSPEERVLRNVIYACCLSEMVAVARLVDSLEWVTEPRIRQILRSLIADEVLHGQFGFLYLEAVAPDGETCASLATYLVHAFAILEQEMIYRAAPASNEARRLGVIDGPRACEVFYGAMESAIIPGLERFGIAAGRAWTTRRRAR